MHSNSTSGSTMATASRRRLRAADSTRHRSPPTRPPRRTAPLLQPPQLPPRILRVHLRRPREQLPARPLVRVQRQGPQPPHLVAPEYVTSHTEIRVSANPERSPRQSATAASSGAAASATSGNAGSRAVLTGGLAMIPLAAAIADFV